MGLDPIQIIEIRDLIQALGKTHTVIFSSHILSEVQTICEKILIIAHGKLIAFDTPENLERQLLPPSEVTILAEATADGVRRHSRFRAAHHRPADRGRRTGPDPAPPQHRFVRRHDLARSLFFSFAKAKKPLVELSVKKANLEDIFLELTEQSPAAAPTEAPAADSQETEAVSQ